MKKIIALALAVVILLCCLVGCSSYKKVQYNTQETFRIPEELFENLTSSRSSIYFEIVLIGYSENDNTYLATYTDNITVHFEVDDNNTVKIID